YAFDCDVSRRRTAALGRSAPRRCCRPPGRLSCVALLLPDLSLPFFRARTPDLPCSGLPCTLGWRYDYFTPRLSGASMGAAVKKTISLPSDLARDAEALARAEGKTLSAVIQDALRVAGIERRLQELRNIQGYWSRKAREKGILTEQDLERFLRR